MVKTGWVKYVHATLRVKMSATRVLKSIHKQMNRCRYDLPKTVSPALSV